MKLAPFFTALYWVCVLQQLYFSNAAEPATLTLLQEAANQGALCLDGSPPGYYFRPGKEGGSNKWILHLMGGGWCFQGTEDCYNRTFTFFGSTNPWARTMEFYGALSPNMETNPSFYNWNMVFLIYCDGASFAGDRDVPESWNGTMLYYRGYKILTAIMEDLNRNRNLTQATDVVLTGCSAGGVSVFMHMNYIQTLVPATARFSGLPDAGFFVDLISYNDTYNPPDFFANLIEFQQVDEALTPECKRDNAGQLWKCMYATYIYQYIEAPIMVLNSRYDTAQLNLLLLLPCLPPNCDSFEVEFFNTVDDVFKQQISVVTSDNSTANGYFLDSCLVHCQTLEDHPWTNFTVQGRSMSQSVYDWYYNSMEVKVEDCDYPCNPSCPGVYPSNDAPTDGTTGTTDGTTGTTDGTTGTTDGATGLAGKVMAWPIFGATILTFRLFV